MRYDTVTLRLTHPTPTAQEIRGPGQPPARTPMPLVLIGGVAAGIGLVGGVAEIRSGRDAGSFVALTCLYAGGQLIRGGPHWLTSTPHGSRARAYAQLFAFLAEWTYHVWPEEEEVAA